MVIVSACLNLSYAPMTIRRFDQIKNNFTSKEGIDKASIYIIGKREEPIKSIKEVNDRKISIEFKTLVPVTVKKM